MIIPKSKKTTPKSMWHPSFVACLQIELQDYRDYLDFQSEINLNKMPRRIDAIVITLTKDLQIEKNFACIFRRCNIFNYKSPSDMPTVNDYYEALSYVLQYKSIDEKKVSIDEITLSFVCQKFPGKIMNDLCNHKLGITNPYQGIYYIEGERIPVQIIVSDELDEDENFFLSSLSPDLDKDRITKLLTIKKDSAEIFNNYVQAIFISNANLVLEVMGMNALLEQLPPEERNELERRAMKVIRLYGWDKMWEAEIEEERRAKEKERQAREEERRAKEKERRAKEEALKAERQAKEENEMLLKKIQELETLIKTT